MHNPDKPSLSPSSEFYLKQICKSPMMMTKNDINVERENEDKDGPLAQLSFQEGNKGVSK